MMCETEMRAHALAVSPLPRGRLPSAGRWLHSGAWGRAAPAHGFFLGLLTVMLCPSGNARPAPQSRSADEARPAPEEPEKPGGREVALPIFKEGIALFDGGDYFGAIQRFSRAYFHFPSSNIHTRIALAYKWLRDHLKAVEYYERYLSETKPKSAEEASRLPEEVKKLREEVQQAIAELMKTISQLKLTVVKPPGAELRINGLSQGRAPMDGLFRFNPGVVVVEVAAKDHTTFRQELKLVAGQTISLQITLDPAAPGNRGGGVAADSL